METKVCVGDHSSVTMTVYLALPRRDSFRVENVTSRQSQQPPELPHLDPKPHQLKHLTLKLHWRISRSYHS
jgi:hypothetical protein